MSVPEYVFTYTYLYMKKKRVGNKGMHAYGFNAYISESLRKEPSLSVSLTL